MESSMGNFETIWDEVIFVWQQLLSDEDSSCTLDERLGFILIYLMVILCLYSFGNTINNFVVVRLDCPCRYFPKIFHPYGMVQAVNNNSINHSITLEKLYRISVENQQYLIGQ